MAKKEIKFLVEYPWGSSYAHQMEEALEGLGFPTLTDPECEGSDGYNFVVAKDDATIAKAGEIFDTYENSDPEDESTWDTKMEALDELPLVYISVDWKHLALNDIKSDAKMLKKYLGLTLKAKQENDDIVVTLSK